ncbi:MAG: hypothetical protein Q9175_002117 [Cornicularia normoerica]
MMVFKENTPPPKDLQKWYDELYADLPDLPEALEDSLRSKYDFRIGVRQNNNVPITYLDQDESGTFDPACKKPPECIPICKKRRERGERIDDGTPKKLKTNTWQGGRWTGRRLPVVLKITSENGRSALEDLGTSHDNWPERLLDPDSSDDSPNDWPEFQTQTYDLRERRRCDLSDPANGSGDDGLHLEDVTLGARVKDVGAGDSNVLTEKREATILNHVSSVSMLLESAWRDLQAEGQGPGHRWTKVPLDPENKTLNPENSARNPESRMPNPKDQWLGAPNAYKT